MLCEDVEMSWGRMRTFASLLSTSCYYPLAYQHNLRCVRIILCRQRYAIFDLSSIPKPVLDNEHAQHGLSCCLPKCSSLSQSAYFELVEMWFERRWQNAR